MGLGKHYQMLGLSKYPVIITPRNLKSQISFLVVILIYNSLLVLKIVLMIEKVEDLLFSGSINPDLFKRKTTKIYEDIENINERLEIMELYLSNLIYQIDKCFEVTYNLPII